MRRDTTSANAHNHERSFIAKQFPDLDEGIQYCSVQTHRVEAGRTLLIIINNGKGFMHYCQ